MTMKIKNAIKRYAQWARQELLIRVTEKAEEYGISDHKLVEEVAYLCFQRSVTLHYMEVNDCLPSHFEHLSDLEKIMALSQYLPYAFDKLPDHVIKLFPHPLYEEGGIMDPMPDWIGEEEWKDNVQIIGWLLQYYNSEKKNQIFADLKKKVKISKENIPVATQFFTPDWIVKYMVENSLGRLWLAGHPDDSLQKKWLYYLPEAKQDQEIERKLEELGRKYARLKPEDIRCIDPCCGSGHILVYVFDLLMDIYLSQGYAREDAVKNILTHNLYGLDLDHRASQLAYFAIMMKACQYDKDFLKRGLQARIYAIVESNDLQLSGKMDRMDMTTYGKDFEEIMEELHDAKEYGSLLHCKERNWAELAKGICRDKLPQAEGLIHAAELLSQKYHVVITNPPYMGLAGMSQKLNQYGRQYYPDSRSDLFAIFMERCREFMVDNGYQAMVTQHSWMFLSSYEKLREKFQKINLVNMAHLGPRAFEKIPGDVVQTTSFVYRNSQIANYQGKYCRLLDAKNSKAKEELFLSHQKEYAACQEDFHLIPGQPIAYWIGKELIHSFSKATLLGHLAACKQGLATADNKRFLRLWQEVRMEDICFTAQNLQQAQVSGKKWFPYNKGGDFRKWYGNNDFLINWENDGYEIKHMMDDKGRIRSRPQNLEYMLKPSVTWSLISSKIAAFRYKPAGYLFDIGGMSFFAKEHVYYLLGLANSTVAREILQAMAPTINYQCGDIANIPVIFCQEREAEVEKLVEENIRLSQEDWDQFENSWDFKKHPLLRGQGLLEDFYKDYDRECSHRFRKVKENEETLNRIFMEIYGLSHTMKEEVEDQYITIRKAQEKRTMIHLISYAVGCMLGRYSSQEEGLQYTGGEWKKEAHTYLAKDQIIPIGHESFF